MSNKADDFWNMGSPLWAVIMRWVYVVTAIIAWLCVILGQYIDLIFAIPFTVMALKDIDK